jgi:hypothetical protein
VPAFRTFWCKEMPMTATHRILCYAFIVLAAAPAGAWAGDILAAPITIQDQAIGHLLKSDALSRLTQAPRPAGVHRRPPRIKSLKPILIGAAVGAGLTTWLCFNVYESGARGQEMAGSAARGAAVGTAIGFAISLR